jgi:hypothetical protein
MVIGYGNQYIIKKNMKDGVILLHLDCGCEINTW